MLIRVDVRRRADMRRSILAIVRDLRLRESCRIVIAVAAAAVVIVTFIGWI